MGSRSRATSPRSRDAVAVRARRAARRKARAARTRREGLARYASSIRLDDAIVFAAVTVVSLWAWVELAIAGGSPGAGPVVVAAVTAIGSFALVTRRYLQWATTRDDPAGIEFTAPLLFLPVVTSPAIFLLITPAGASTAGFAPWLPVAGVIGLAGLLSLAGVLAGLLAFGLLVWPLFLLFDAARPPARVETPAGGLSGLSRQLTRAELAGGGILVPLSVAFAGCMVNVYPDATGSTRERMTETLLAWASGRGEPVPSVLALVVVLATAATVWITGRAGVRAKR